MLITEMRKIIQKWLASNSQLRKAAHVLPFLLLSIIVGLILNKTYWRDEVNAAAANNHSIVVAIRNDLENLPQLAALPVGGISDEYDPAIYQYRSFLESEIEQSLTDGSILRHGVRSIDIWNLNRGTSDLIREVKINVESTVDALDAFKKFMQYSPEDDLAPVINGDESGSSERIKRTVEGIEQTLSRAKKLEHKYSPEIVGALSALPSQAQAVTRYNYPDWAKSVATAQNQIRQLLVEDATEYRQRYSRLLAEKYEKYLNLRYR